MKNKLVIILLLLLLVTSVVEAEEGSLTSEQLRYLKEEEIYLATGDVYFSYQADEITAEQLEMNRKTEELFFSGDVYLEQIDGAQIWGQQLTLKLQEELLIAEDEVRLKTEKEGKQLDLTADYLKIWTDTDELLAKGNLFVIYDGQEITGERLKSQADKNKIIITENVEIREDDQWLQAKKVVIDLETGDFDATGKVKLEFEL
ncbi:LPS export ABC transporter periplasmic protein LptC [Natroniella acetigena]|uniref:LptA/OstA family protein n=1 Tax=Natroniella acetigena TaxID=52004 RepID=UPI00200B477B|nr:LptA/OstA family protein [Natroniella acetigena]MCK8827336.1 LPS export ABC transporter periplasmic protein LptC [Natroniella acetigena]